mgnify:CR=1 FL=1
MGNERQDYNITKYLDTDMSALSDFFSLIEKGGMKTEDALNAVMSNMQQAGKETSVFFEDFSKKIDGTGKSFLELATVYFPQYILGVTGATTATEFFDAILKKAGATALSVGLSMAQAFAFAAVIDIAIKSVQKLWSVIKAGARDTSIGLTGYDVFESYEKAAEKLNESANTTKQATSELDNYKDKVNELRESIDSGTLSESEAYDARKELISIQDTLVEKYNMEASGIDLVNGKLDEQIAKINAVSDAKANQFLDDPDNKRAYKEAQMYMGQESFYTTKTNRLYASDDELENLQQIADKYGLTLRELGRKQINARDSKVNFTIDITADPTKAEDAYSSFVQEVSSDSKISDSLKADIDTYTQEARESASTIISNYQEESDAARDFQIQTTSAYKALNDELVDAQESYEDAIASGDNTRIDAALKKVKQVKDSISNMSFNQPGLDSGANKVIEDYFQTQADQLDSATKQSFAQQALNEGFSQAAQVYKECQKNLADLNDEYKQYGNISNTNRDVLKWNTENLKKYKDVIASWKWDVGAGDYSTVEATSGSFGEGDNEVEIAYTPMLQTNSGLVPFSADTMNEYINSLVEKATDSKTGKIDVDKLMELDAEGLYIQVDGAEQKISNMIAAVQGQIVNGAQLTAADVAAIAGSSAIELQEVFGETSDYVGHSMHDVQDSVLRWKTMIDDPNGINPLKEFTDASGLDAEEAQSAFDKITDGLESIKKNRLQDTDILNIESISKVNPELENLTDGTKKAVDAYNDLKSAAETLDIPLDNLIDTLVKLGLVYSDNIKYTNEFTSSALTTATAATKAVSSVTSILNSQGTGINIDTDSYSELIKDNAEYAAALQYTNGTMQLNREMTQKLTDAKVKEAEAIIKVAYSQNQYKYQEVRSDLSKYTDEVRKSIEADADKLKQFDEEKAALESQSEALRENCRSLQMQYSALMQASSAYQDWLNAQNATESGDMYDSAIEAKKALAEGLKNGKVGTVKWQAASEFLIPDDYEGTAAEYIKKLNRYFKQASDGSDDGSGINNFITDSLKAGLMKQEKDGSIQILADKTTEDFAKALKLSPDAVQSIFGEMQEYGWTFDWGSMLGDPITNYQMQLEDLKDTMDSLDPDSEEWEIVNEQAEQLQTTLDGLMQRSGLDQLADVVADANEQGQGFSEEVQSAADALDSAARVQLAIDVSDAKDAITEAQKNLDSNKTLENYDALQKAEEEYNKLLQKQEQVGDPTQVEIDMYLKEDTSDGTTVSEKIENLQKAGLIQVPVESDDSQLQQAADELDTLKDKAADPVKITADSSDAMTKINNLGTAISNLIKDYTINIKVNQSSSNSGSSGRNQKSTPYAAQYHGINGAYGGAFAGGRTLVGELGNELVVNPHSGKWYTVGDNGAEFVNLPKDAIVFDHSKTKKLLDQGFIGGRGVALASGTAMDSGSPGMGSYVGGSTGYRVGQDPRVKNTYKATTASTKATKDNTTALEENKKALEKQKKALEKQKDALEKESNKLKIYGQAAINEIEKRITALNKEKDAQDKVYESQIKELEKRKTALQKANDEEDRAIKLAELQDALAKAQANKTVRIYNKNEGFVWRADQQEVNDAQTDLDDQKRQWKNDDILQSIDDEIERINNLKDAYDESIEAQIDDLEAMKDKWNEVISLIGTSWEDYQLGLEAAAHFQNMSLDGMGKDLVGYKDDVLANMQEIGGVTDQIDSITESIEQLDKAIQNAKDSSSSGGGSGGSGDFGGVDTGADVEADSDLSQDTQDLLDHLKELREEYANLGDETDELSEKQLGLVDTIADATIGTREHFNAVNDLGTAQYETGQKQSQMQDILTTYMDLLSQCTDLTDEQRTELVQSMDDVVNSYSNGYETIDQLLDAYADNIIQNSDLTIEERQKQLDNLVEFSEQYGAAYDSVNDILDHSAEVIAENTELTNTQRQSQIDNLVALADQYGISKDTILQHLIDIASQEEISKTSTAEAHQAMLETVQAACESMNVSYQSTINKINELSAAAQAAILKQKELAATHVNHNGGGGSKATQTAVRYATGVLNAATTHIAITDEQGPEIKMRKPSAGNYSLIERGSSVIPAQPSANIWKMGIDPDSFISQHMPQRSIKSVEITQPDASGVSVSVGDIQMYGVNDVESFGRVIHERVGTIFAQEFSRR